MAKNVATTPSQVRPRNWRSSINPYVVEDVGLTLAEVRDARAGSTPRWVEHR